MNISIEPKRTFTVSIGETFVREYTPLELAAIGMWMYAVENGITRSPLLIKGNSTYCGVFGNENACVIDDIMLSDITATGLINAIDNVINSNPLNCTPIVPDTNVFQDGSTMGIFRLFNTPDKSNNSFICVGLNNLKFRKEKGEVITDQDEYYNGKLFSLSPIGLAYSTDLECFYPIKGVPNVSQFGQNTFKFEDFSLSQQ